MLFLQCIARFAFASVSFHLPVVIAALPSMISHLTLKHFAHSGDQGTLAASVTFL